MGDIRSSSAFEVGMMGTNYPFTNFTSISSGNLAGTALKLSYEQTTNVIIYYFNPTNYSLYRYTNGVAGSFMVVSGLTNTGVFRAESYQGTNLTAGVGVDQYSMVGVFMEFYQFQYPLTRVGTGSNYMYDYYKMEFKASSRNYN